MCLFSNVTPYYNIGKLNCKVHMLHFVCGVCCFLFCVPVVLCLYLQNALRKWKNTEILFSYTWVFVSVVLYRRFDRQQWMTFLRGVIIHMEEIAPTHHSPLPLTLMMIKKTLIQILGLIKCTYSQRANNVFIGDTLIGVSIRYGEKVCLLFIKWITLRVF